MVFLLIDFQTPKNLRYQILLSFFFLFISVLITIKMGASYVCVNGKLCRSDGCGSLKRSYASYMVSKHDSLLASAIWKHLFSFKPKQPRAVKRTTTVNSMVCKTSVKHPTLKPLHQHNWPALSSLADETWTRKEVFMCAAACDKCHFEKKK